MIEKGNVKNKKKEEIEKLTPEKWARKEGLDEDLFKWWSINKGLISENEFKKIKKQVYGE